MDAQRFQKVKDLFGEASDVAVDARESFLRERCGEDSELFDEVSSLLAALDEPQNVIEGNGIDLRRAVVGTESADGVKSFSGRRFGNYEIVREIGRGGMGAVFLAERADGEFSQQVALKIVRRSIVGAETERRFRQEREILAALNHPNIARLYDGGVSDEGEAFLAMEFVAGETLLEYSAKRAAGLRDRLKLFVKICAAVAYAHRNLTIHRDLKPSNIIVNEDGEPKLLDFGLAKMLVADADSDQTATLFRAFTPAYASPEQILGRPVTTASDIYSLGVVFYELMSGAKPFEFDGKSLEEVIGTITDSAPKPPSQAIKPADFQGGMLDSDIDVIALKALETEPELRYQTVEAMANDIELYLSGLPILARPPSISYRASKFVRRNLVSVAAASVVFVSIVAGVAIALWQANETRKERDRAEQRFNDVRVLSNSLLFEIGPKIENLNGSTEARELLVKRALEYLDSLSRESQNDLAIRSELAAAYEKIGDLQGNPARPNLSDFTGAILSYEKAREIRLTLAPTDENRLLTAKNLVNSSATRYAHGEVTQAIDDSRAALAIYGEIAARSGVSGFEADFFEARIDNAQIYADNNQYKEAIPLFEKIVAEPALANGADKELRRLNVKAVSHFANALSWDGRQPEAESEMARANELAEKLIEEYSNDPLIRQQVWRTWSLAASINEEVNNERAFEFATRALRVAESSVAADAADSQARLNLAKSFSRLGNEAVLVGKLTFAMENLRKSESILRELTEKEPKNVAYQRDFGRLYIRLGDLSRKRKDFGLALANYKSSVEFFEKVSRLDERSTLARRDTAQSLRNVAEMEVELGRTNDADATYRKALSILKELESQNALGEADKPMIGKIQTALDALAQ